ncbi:MAG: Wzz/FepE/Etk N-terminal domain-containing protein [Bryobacteraceae bacterium]
MEPRTGVFNRRAMDLEDYLNIVRRHVGWILGPTLAGLTIAVMVAFFYPDTFQSSATIRVVPPTIPTRLVDPNFGMQMADRINNMQQTILSRNTLTNIIQTHDLYRKERNSMPMEDIIERMSKAILVGQPQRVNSGSGNTAVFRIAYSYQNRYLAQRVTRDLVSRFMDENMRERATATKQTTQFLREQYETAKLELDAIESKLTQFKMANLSRLPESMGANMQTVGMLESRVSAINSSISRAKQEQTMLESEMRATREKLNAVMRMPASDGPVGTAAALAGGGPNEIEIEIARVERETQAMERTLERMLEQYTPTYPDVQRLKTRIASLRKERDDLLNRKLTLKPSAPQTSAPTPAAVARVNPGRAREIAEIESGITRLQGQIRAKEMEVERYVREISDAERRSREVQARIEVGPISMAQIEQLTRDHELAKRKYDDLKQRLSQAEMIQDVEDRKQGETLEVLDPPSLPETQVAPNRPVIIGSGIVLGLLIGAALAAVREIKDTSLKSLKDIRAYTQFNVLGSIPLLENDLVVRRRRRLSWLGWTTASVLGVVIMAVSIYYYYYVAKL